MKIQQLDLWGQYTKIKGEIDQAINDCLATMAFINGPNLIKFQKELESYLCVDDVILCGNGTDALQIALMALKLEPNDEVIIPCFTYVAVAEVVALLGLKPIMVDVDSQTFNIAVDKIEASITPKTKAIIPVHLFGQCADMEPILQLAKKYSLYVIEDSAQAIGATYTFSNGEIKQAGIMGDIGCTSFFPSKNLACYGDGGALYTDNKELATKIRMIANHGQIKKYHHELVGVNSRLDSIQAAILSVKIKYLNEYINCRINAANYYNDKLRNIDWLELPAHKEGDKHVFNQYTVIVNNPKNRDDLKNYLEEKGVPTAIHYPIPLHLQQAYKYLNYKKGDFPIAEKLCDSVLSLPMHTELTLQEQDYIADAIQKFQ